MSLMGDNEPQLGAYTQGPGGSEPVSGFLASIFDL